MGRNGKYDHGGGHHVQIHDSRTVMLTTVVALAVALWMERHDKARTNERLAAVEARLGLVLPRPVAPMLTRVPLPPTRAPSPGPIPTRTTLDFANGPSIRIGDSEYVRPLIVPVPKTEMNPVKR